MIIIIADNICGVNHKYRPGMHVVDTPPHIFKTTWSNNRGVDLRTILGIGLDLGPWVVSRSGSRSVSK